MALSKITEGQSRKTSWKRRQGRKEGHSRGGKGGGGQTENLNALEMLDRGK